MITISGIAEVVAISDRIVAGRQVITDTYVNQGGQHRD